MGVLKQQKNVVWFVLQWFQIDILCMERRHKQSHCHFQSMSFYDQAALSPVVKKSIKSEVS